MFNLSFVADGWPFALKLPATLLSFSPPFLPSVKKAI